MSGNYYKRCFTSSLPDPIQTVDEYHGENVVVLACTDLSKAKYPTQGQRKKILNEWIDFLRSNPNAIDNLHCVTRMNQQLFDAICCQKNLFELNIKWGMYPSLSKITNLQRLECLMLCAGASTKDISPIGELTQLEALCLSTVGVHDYSPLSHLHGLKELGIHSGMDNLVKVNDLKFLYQLIELKNFHTTGFRLIDSDYSPVLSLDKLEFLSVNMPAYDYKIWNNKFAEYFSGIACNRHLDPFAL